jgi:hypothetical protein
MAVRAYMLMISDHYMSYDQYSHLYKFYELPRVNFPHMQFFCSWMMQDDGVLARAS